MRYTAIPAAPSRICRILGWLCLASVTIFPLTAQPAPEPDVMIFIDGERLVGHLVRSTGGSATFKSDMLGDVNVEWSKVREFQSSQRFAVVEKGVELHRSEAAAQIPQGAIAITDKQIEIRGTPQSAPRTIPIENAAYVVDEASFHRAVETKPGLLSAWKGTVTAGASLVEATQNSRTFTTGISLIRAIPTENWLDPRNRTLVDFSASYGRVDQPNTPELKTAIYHAGAERDEYFSPRLYGFGQTAFDHNFSQGLALQQSYDGGIGWTAIKEAHQTLDLKASLGYVKQSFSDSVDDHDLIGSIFGERYNREFPHGMFFTQQLSLVPAWNNTSAYSAAASAALTMPVYKRLSFTVGGIDTFLNDPPPGFKKNSFQLTTGLTYSLP